MKDLIAEKTSGLFVEVGKVIEHMKVQQERIADLERENARIDAALDEEISTRDQYHEWADRLAAEIARYFGVDIGEHSNANNPWEQAYEAVPSEASAPAVGRQQWSHVTPRDFVEVATAIMDQHGLMDGLSYEKTEKLCEAMEESFKKLPHPAPQAADTDKVREAIFMAAIPVMAINGMNNFSSWEHECWARGALAMRTEVLGILSDMAAQAPMREVSGWISIDDHLPEYGTEVLVFQPEKECKVTALARFTSNVWDYYWDAAHIGKGRMTRPASVTHWLPLPAAPVQQEGDRG